jgi:FkbH-like protein
MSDFPQSNGAVAITATFTADPILPSLDFVLHEAGLNLVVGLSPYNQVFQELLSSASLLGTNTSGVNVILIRLEDFVREVDDPEDALTIIRRTAVEFTDTLTCYAQHVRVPTLLSVMPPSPRVDAALLTEINLATAQVLLHARALPGIALLSSEELEVGSPEESYDNAGDELAHMPFTEVHYASLGLAIARKVHALLVPAHKVLVLDCDETLWRGIVGEDGVEGISIPKSLACLQQFAVKIQSQGTLLCLVSKNTERDVLAVFAKRTEMILKLEHLVAHRINWEPKARNIVSLAKSLNLGLESFVFIDDSPVECALMRAELPQVVTLQLPPDDEIESFLAHLWTFDKVAVTAEDTRRTSMYRENAARQELEQATTNISEFIESLGVVTEIAPPEESEWTRAAQLTQRTNQFNFTTVRHSELELRARPGDGSTVLRVKVRDRFGDYGLVGLVIIVDDVSRVLRVDTLLLSCRVLGRGVEHAILRHLGELASQRGLQFIDLQYVPTRSNEPARAFAESVATEFRMEDEQNRILYHIPVDNACAILHHPGQDPIAVIEARKSEAKKDPPPVLCLSNNERSERYTKLARTFISGRKLLDAIRTRGVRPSTLPGKPEMPATDLEQAILALWQELLGIDGLGVEDDYFALGGTSLIAARLFAEIAQRFGVRLPLTTILEAPTVRSLSRHIEQRDAPPTDSSATHADHWKASQTWTTQKRQGGLIELRRGGPRKLFLVHDGKGETLLYLNLAQRMPNDLAVFGIEPRRIQGIPLAQATIEEMAAFYIEEMRQKQAHGPYLLGGLCAGGVIAYEMASQLVRVGESIALVALLEAAVPRAKQKPWRITGRRLSRLKQAVADSREDEPSSLTRLWIVIGAIAQKSLNVLLWKISQSVSQLWVRGRFFLLRQVLKRELAWPRLIPELSVQQIYDSAEALYNPKPLPISSLLLVRAQSGQGGDTPYRDLYADRTFGWDTVAHPISVVDVEGGHSTMLEERFVDSLAKALLPYLQPKVRPLRERSLESNIL